MCGIIGMIGREPAAPQLIDALKRLEYRGYDSAGVATLEHGQLTRRRAEGKLKNLEQRLAREPLLGTHRHRPHPLGDARPPDREQRAPARHRSAGGRAQRHHRKFRRAATRTRSQRREIQHRDRHRSHRASCFAENGARRFAGRCGQGGAAAVARRIRARLPVCRRRQPSDRRAQGLAARDRFRRRRDVCRLRCDRAGAVHRHRELSRRRRLGDHHPQRAPRSTTATATSCSARC